MKSHGLKSRAMKKFVLSGVAGLGLLSGVVGCETPAYTTQERFQLIGRNWGYEYEQSQEDVDHIFLLQPVSKLSEWDVQ